jgi:hypothetical protein
MWLVCDCGYGFPKEVRPRQEKLNAISRQLVNFLVWQQQNCNAEEQSASPPQSPARLLIVLGTGECRTRPSTTLPNAAKNDPVPSVAAKVACSREEATIVGTPNVDTASTNGLPQLHTVLLDRMHQVWNQQRVVDSTTPAFPIDRIVFTYDALTEAIEKLQRQLDSAVETESTSHAGTIVPTIDLPPLVEDTRAFNLFCAADESTAPTTAENCAGGGLDNRQCDKDTNVAGRRRCALVVYLSPDAQAVLDVAATSPPPIVIVGMLIDRRTIQLNRSSRRAQAMVIPTARWPLEQCATSAALSSPTFETSPDQDNTSATSTLLVDFHPNEPLNVDCVLEGMQRWDWNCSRHRHCTDQDKGSPPLILAISQALRHHQQRHPQRVRHKELDNDEVVEMSNQFSRAQV